MTTHFTTNILTAELLRKSSSNSLLEFMKTPNFSRALKRCITLASKKKSIVSLSSEEPVNALIASLPKGKYLLFPIMEIIDAYCSEGLVRSIEYWEEAWPYVQFKLLKVLVYYVVLPLSATSRFCVQDGFIYFTHFFVILFWEAIDGILKFLVVRCRWDSRFYTFEKYARISHHIYMRFVMPYFFSVYGEYC